ncbi:MAG: Eco57I restriction-modification methylase domain-containing protein [Marmoricola sp.]
MTKKFDVVIGNPPYQVEARGTATHAMPIYHLFMDAAYEVAEKAVLITPARFLFNAGYTPKAWNEKMLADEHLMVAHFEPDSNALFPSLTDTIKGGIAVTYRDSERKLGPIVTFSGHPELNSILHKVTEADFEPLGTLGITSSRSFRYTAKMHEDHPQALALMSAGEQFKINTRTFDQLAFLYSKERPQDDHVYSRVLGLDGRARAYRWIRSDYVAGPDNFDKYKVAVPKANGSGSTTDFFGVALTNPTVLEPGVAVTQTFLTIGAFATEAEAQACLKFIKSKFARAMLGVLKITPDNPAKVWKYVPAQNFNRSSDIDWTKSIPEIDAQLYAKYGLDDDEIAFIEANVKPME